MFMIDAGSTFIAIFIAIGLYALIKRKRLKTQWGDMKYGILMLMLQYGLYKLSQKEPNVESWRPNILVLSGAPTARWYLIEIANAISRGYGLLTVAAVIAENRASYQRQESLEKTITAYLENRDVMALVKVYFADEVISGITSLIKGYGFGPLEPNTILIGETARENNLPKFTELVRMLHENRRNVIIIKEGELPNGERKKRRVDIWWGQKGQNAGLILALANLLSESPQWRNARIALKTICAASDDPQESERGLRAFAEKGRLDVSVDAVRAAPGADVFSLIEASSRDADFIFLGLRAPVPDEGPEPYSRYLWGVFQNTRSIPSVAYVLASENLDFKKIYLSS
jgi:hypothetical protein